MIWDIPNMDDMHLIRTVKYLVRSAMSEECLAYASVLGGNPFQGEMASASFDAIADQVFNSTWEDYLHEQFWDMCHELEERSLQFDYDGYAKSLETLPRERKGILG